MLNLSKDALMCIAQHLYGDDALRFFWSYPRFFRLFSSKEEKYNFAYGTRSILLVRDKNDNNHSYDELQRLRELKQCRCCKQYFTLQRLPTHLLKCSQNTFLRYRVIVRWRTAIDVYNNPIVLTCIQQWHGGERGISSYQAYMRHGLNGVNALWRIGRCGVDRVDNTVTDDGLRVNEKCEMDIITM
jgi:hypothetical protein